MNKILLLGDTSIPEALGSKLLRGSQTSKKLQDWNIDTMYNSAAITFSPSMRRKRGRIFYRLAGKRSWEWWEFQDKLEKYILNYQPKLIIVTGILPIKKSVFKVAKRNGVLIVNYLTDDPWNRVHYRQTFTSSIKYYNHIFSTKKALQTKLKKEGAVSTSWLPFAYDPHIHYPQKCGNSKDIIFVGTGDKERLLWLNSLADIDNVERNIYGNNWEKIDTPGWSKHSEVTGDEYCKTISNATIVLGLLRSANRDKSTDRSYEIGAIKGCGIYQDTEEHRDLLKGYPEEGFFKNPDDLKSKVEILLGSEVLREELRNKGNYLVAKYENTYAARLEEIVEYLFS